jgi:hypothetical protein
MQRNIETNVRLWSKINMKFQRGNSEANRKDKLFGLKVTVLPSMTAD